MKSLGYAALLFGLVALCTAQEDIVASAIESLQRGDTAAAEQRMRAQLDSSPGDSLAAGVLAVVLDQERRYDQAERFYARALAGNHNDPALLNNYGNHLLALGEVERARRIYRQVVSIKPQHANARLQLATLALKRKEFSEAQDDLAHLPQAAGESREALLLQMQVDYLLNRMAAADAVLARLMQVAERDTDFNLALGSALANAGRYEAAEKRFQQLAEAEPQNAAALYDLALAASHAGHFADALRDLLRVIELQPDNAAAMYDLAVVYRSSNQDEQALELLARACRLQPSRPDIHRLLAQILEDEGYFSDAVHAWDDYLKLNSDDQARRERAFAATAIDRDTVNSLAELRSYVNRHPGDATGHYELGLAAVQDPALSKSELDRALASRPRFAAARIARGYWFTRHGEAGLALADFQIAAEQDDNNPRVLDRLAQAYAAVGQTDTALPILQNATALAPTDSTILLHLARLQLKAGHTEEAQTLFARVRVQGPAMPANSHASGLLEFLKLSPGEQQARYKAGVARAARSRPTDAEAQARYLELLSEEDTSPELTSVCTALSQLSAGAGLFAQAARAILSSERPSLPCASSLLEAGLKQHSGDDALLGLKRVAAGLDQ